MAFQPNRREFLKTSAAAVGAGAVVNSAVKPLFAEDGISPVVVASANGLHAVAKAYEVMMGGGSTLDAVIAGVNLVEDDPNDQSVGLGGLPNEDGIVELDSSVMDGPTYGAGAVGSLRNIRNPSKVARLVMERTDHVLIVGPGALKFAKAHGFQEENLLTEASRKRWLAWKENLNPNDNWKAPKKSNPNKDRPTGTINCLAINTKGDISGVTTTSGLAWKIEGRVGDSPLIGCGLYVDNNVGASGSTGRGEEAIKSNGSFHTVMQMALGKNPTEACLATLKRIADSYKMDMDWLSQFEINFYAINKAGVYGAANLWGSEDKGDYAVCDAKGARLERRAFLFHTKDRKPRW